LSTNGNIRLPEPLLAQMQETAASEGKSVDELTEEAVKRLLSQRLVEKLKRQAEERRENMTDAEVEETVDRAISEYRAESRQKAGGTVRDQ
jgi:hypothetical protein